MKINPLVPHVQNSIVNATLSPTTSTPQKNQEEIKEYPLYNGKVLNVEPSHLWLKRLGQNNTIQDSQKEKIKNEILLDKHDPNFPNKLIDSWQKYGFAIIKDKDSDSHTIEETYKIMRVFFQKDISYKKQLGLVGQNNNDGYIPPDTEVSVSAIGNLNIKKQINVFEMVHRTVDRKNKNINDELGKNFQELTDKLLVDLHTQAKEIAKAMAIGLQNKGFLTPTGKKLNENYFTNLMEVNQGEIDDLNLIRLTHCKAYEANESTNFGCTLAHTDLNFLSILPTATKEGLQIWFEDHENPENNGWVQIDAPRDSYIINLADQADILTRGYLKSTPHRVISPIGQDRYSIIFFAGFNRNTDLTKVKLSHPIYTGNSRFELESIPRIKSQELTSKSFTDLRKMDIGVLPENEELFIPIRDLEYMKTSI